MTGPSATGSEKGMPISIKLTPAFAIIRMYFSVVVIPWSPAVMKGINAFFVKACAIVILFM